MKKISIVLLISTLLLTFGGLSFADLPLEEIEALHQLALHSNSVSLRVRAIRALAKIGSRKSIKILTKIMTEAVDLRVQNDPQYHARMEKARVAALRAMRKIGMTSRDANTVSPQMMRVLRADPAERVQAEAALSLGVVGSKSTGRMKERVTENMLYKLNRCPVTKNLLAFMLIRGMEKLNVRTAKVGAALLGAYQRGYLSIVRLAAKKAVKKLFPGKYNL